MGGAGLCSSREGGDEGRPALNLHKAAWENSQKHRLKITQVLKLPIAPLALHAVFQPHQGLAHHSSRPVSHHTWLGPESHFTAFSCCCLSSHPPHSLQGTANFGDQLSATSEVFLTTALPQASSSRSPPASASIPCCSHIRTLIIVHCSQVFTATQDLPPLCHSPHNLLPLVTDLDGWSMKV